jgi:phospholipase/carboxylesterase
MPNPDVQIPLKTYHIPVLIPPIDSVVIFLHGLGDSGAGGLLGIGQMWQQALPNTEFLCPDAPFAFDMASPDFGGRQWFSLRDFTQQAIDEGVRSAAPILNDYIDAVLATRNFKPAQLALVGFSQGTMMALHVALRRAEPVAAIVGYSGILTNTTNLAAEKRCAPPVLLIHGTADEMVPFAAMGEAKQTLQSAGVAVKALACPRLGHSIDDAGIVAGMHFVREALGSSKNAQR